VSGKKYEKCISEAKKVRIGPYAALPTTRIGYGESCNIFQNELCPNSIEIVLNFDTVVSSAGNTVKLPDGYEGKIFPHKHAVPEIFHSVGTDPDNPDDLGATVEHWMGEGEEAEGVWTTKPSTVIVPASLTHLPFSIREVRKPFLSLSIIDQPFATSVRVPIVPSGFKIERKPEDPIPQVQKYAKYISELNLNDAPVFPSHKGKSYVAMLHDYKQNELAPHYVRIDMIYGSGIGWGCGDIMQMPHAVLFNVNTTRRSLPIKHPVTATYLFISTNDFDHMEDLGGTVEFWIGEGTQAEQYIITKPTNIFIPQMTVHQPIYIREVHKPFLMATILETPLWSAAYTEQFPTAFNNVAEGKQV